MQIRDAVADDVEAIRAIYNDVVASTTATWNETLVDAANRRKWMAERRSRGYPILVAVDVAQRVVGYASFDDWRALESYRFTVEHAVYVRADQRGNGVGRALLEALIERAQALGKHVMLAGVEAGNRASLAMHMQMGFQRTGLLLEVGTKSGRWLNLVFLQLLLDREAP